MNPKRSQTKPHDTRPMRLVLILGVALLILSFHAYYYRAFLFDDALISLRYADRLLDGDGLTWNAGERVEGYSNLLWVLSAAALGAMGIDLVVAIRLLGLIAMASVVGALAYWQFRSVSPSLLPFAVGSLTWVLAGPTAIWAVGGMEQALVAGLLAWVLAMCLADGVTTPPRHDRFIGFLLALLALTRPDGFLFAGVVAIWIFVFSRAERRLRRTFTVVVPPILAVIGQTVFRWSYYHDWIPNTARIKVTPSAAHLGAGLVYAGKGLLALMPLSLVAIGAMLWMVSKPETRRPGSLLFGLSVLWLGFVVGIGGDISGGWRHMVPFVVMMVFALVLALSKMSGALRSRYWLESVAIAMLWFGFIQFTNAGNVRARNERWVWDGREVGRMLGRGFSNERPLLAVTAAGALPYWSGLPCMDLLGLNDRYLARRPSASAGEMWIGHGFGDSGYLLERRPDLILFGTPAGHPPVFGYADELPHISAFIENYDLCNFAVPEIGFSSSIYVDRWSKTIGMVVGDGEVFVPAYLLTSEGMAYTLLDGNDRFRLVIPPGSSGGARAIPLRAGRWQIVDGASGGIALIGEQSTIEPSLQDGVWFLDVPADGAYDVAIRNPTTSPLNTGGLRLRRIAN